MGINYGKKGFFIIIILAVIVLFMGCDGQGNSNDVFNSIRMDSTKSDVLAVIINNPSDDNLKRIDHLKTFEFDNTSAETLLIIPKYNKMNIEIKTLVWRDNALKEDKTIYKEESTTGGFGLLLKASRPCGIPALKICIDGNEMNGEYILAYNGKDGSPDVEYITKKED